MKWQRTHIPKVNPINSSISGLSIPEKDTKHWILSDGITTLPYFHWRNMVYKNMVKYGVSHEEAEKRAMKVNLPEKYQNECVSYISSFINITLKMAYIKCKIWPFSDDLIHQEARNEAIKAEHSHYTVKALIDTTSNGKDRLVSGSDNVFNDFEVIKKPCADLVLGLPWLYLRNAKIDIQKEGIKIYGDFVPFCKGPDNSDSEAESSKSDSTELRKRVKKLEQTVDWIGTYIEKQTGLEADKELTDSFESSLAEEAYTIEEPRESDSDNMPPIIIKRKIHNENKKSVNKKVKPRRNPTRACKNN
ncbi:hypothetical protein RclHR1_35930001 [Rhizophagus clarus]|uniref:Uncharacterized protein n=1 Tax=Rhizophagus clarus TaxID=94130 RepID=A0A2Z6RB47_9GLOM|nr:hypothetical protein RclHR1_35930001 [Rhizophagus clarus]